MIGTPCNDQRSADLFAQCGQPAAAPWRLALVRILPFAENLSDRQTADAVRGRINGKYAPRLELTDAGCDFSVPVRFRVRLLDGEAEKGSQAYSSPVSTFAKGRDTHAPGAPS